MKWEMHLKKVPRMQDRDKQKILKRSRMNRLNGLRNIYLGENQDGGVGRHTVAPCKTRTDRKSNGKEV